MKKYALWAIPALLVLFTVFAVVVLATPSDVVYLLNWGEYIDRSLVKEFEAKYSCQVIEEDVTSSEEMYQKIQSATTTYDVAIPGDYTVHQLYEEGKLVEIDVDNPDYGNLQNYATMFTPSLKAVMDEDMKDKEGKDFSTYYMPYFWGAYSLLYSKEKKDVPETVEKNGFASLYDRSLFGQDVRIGMYDNARWIVASYLLSQGRDPNEVDDSGSEEGDLSEETRKEIIAGLRKASFDEFGNDQLKRDVANGSLDLCFTQSGDFFDALYLSFQGGEKEASFGIDVPEKTACFFDSMVIPSTVQNKRLANAFINFMMDPENAYQNARSIGYSPTLSAVAEKFHEHAAKKENYYEDEKSGFRYSLEDFLSSYPTYLDPLERVKKAYLLKPKSVKYLTTCETIFNALALDN